MISLSRRLPLGDHRLQEREAGAGYPSVKDNHMTSQDDTVNSNPFFKQVYSIVEQIPCGKVVSYGQIARMLGCPRSARVVGWAMRCCPDHLPWQRVVMADGSITGGLYANIRKALLEAEGVTFLKDGRVDMKSCGWSG